MRPVLPQSKVSNMKMEIVESVNMNIGFGIGSEAIFNRHDTKRIKENIYFDFSNSDIWIDSNILNTGFKVKKGSIVRLQADLSYKQLKFYVKLTAEKKEHFKLAIDLPRNLVETDLFFFISLQNREDQVRLKFFE